MKLETPEIRKEARAGKNYIPSMILSHELAMVLEFNVLGFLVSCGDIICWNIDHFETSGLSLTAFSLHIVLIGLLLVLRVQVSRILSLATGLATSQPLKTRDF